VERAIALLQRCPLGTGQSAEGVLERLRWEVGIEPCQGVTQALVKDDLAVILPLSIKPIRGDFRPLLHLPARL